MLQRSFKQLSNYFNNKSNGLILIVILLVEVDIIIAKPDVPAYYYIRTFLKDLA